MSRSFPDWLPPVALYWVLLVAAGIVGLVLWRAGDSLAFIFVVLLTAPWSVLFSLLAEYLGLLTPVAAWFGGALGAALNSLIVGWLFAQRKMSSPQG